MKRRAGLLLLLVLAALLLATTAQAMSSPGYRLDWLIPLTSGGGGGAASANYAVNITVGQTAVGQAESAGFGLGLGYWQAVWESLRQIFLPLLVK